MIKVMLFIVLVAIILGALLPPVNMTSPPGEPSFSSNLKGIVTSMIAYSYDHQGVYPPNLQVLTTWSEGDVTPRLLIDPKHPKMTEPFVYVRPAPTASRSIPVLIADPACTDGTTSLVAYADGHTGKVPGHALWDEAKRLAALPKSQAGGIEMSDWTTVPELQKPTH